MYDELIKALRYCISDNADDCYLCPYQSDCKSNGTGQGKMIRDAADALEAAEQRIKELESQAAFFDAEKLNYQENIIYRDERIKELEAAEKKMPKDGEWRGLIIDGQYWAITCSNCHQVGFNARTPYCPNCGADMRKGERNEQQS